MSKREKLLSTLIVFLTIAELLLVLLSWILSSMMADGVRSLLSSEGIRWFFGQYVQWLQSPFLIYLLLLSLAVGIVIRSGILRKPLVYRENMARKVSLASMFCYLAVLGALTMIPHAILLSATGALFPSPFSKALVPLVAFGLIFVSLVYGLLAHSFTSVKSVIDASTWGLAKAAPLFLLYVFFIQFYESLCYVFILNTYF